MGSRKRYCVFGCGDKFGASMHMFPHPVKRASMFQQWMKQVEHKLQETDQIRIFRNKRMCDYHFEPMYKTTGHRLSINAVPTLHLDGFFESQACSSEQEHAYRIPTYNIDEIWDPETGLQTSSDGTVVPGTEATASASGDTSQNVDIGAFYENFLDNETESRTDDDAAEAAGPFSWQNDAATVPDTEVLDTIPVAAKPACPAPPARSVLHADPLEESLYDETPLHKDTPDTYSVSGAGEREQHLCCNVCAGAVTGFRYTCVQCADYDLCAQCEARAAHAHHYMLRVPGPKPYDEVRQILDSVRRILNDGFVQISADQIKEEVKEEEADPFSVVEDVLEDVTGAEAAASPPGSHHPDQYEESDDDINRSPPHSPHQTQPNTTTKSLDSPIVMHKIVVIPNHEQTNPKNMLKPEENILEIDCRTINTEIVDPKLLLNPKVILDKIVVLPITEPMTLMPSEDKKLRTQGNMQKIVMQSSHHNDKPPVSSTSMRKQTLIRSDDRTKHLPMQLTGDQMKLLTLQGNKEIAMRPDRHKKPTPVLATFKRKQTLVTSDDQTTRYIKRTDDQAKFETRQANTHKVAILSHNNKKPTPVSSMAEQTLITSADEMKRLPVNHTAENTKFLTRLDNKQVIVMRPSHSEAKPTPITSTAKQTLKTLTTAQMKLLPMNLNDQAKFKRVVLSPAQAKLLNLSRLQPKSLVNISDEDRKRLKPVKFSELVKLGGKKMEQIVKVTAGPSFATMSKPTAEQGVGTSLSIEIIGASTKRKLNVKFQKPSKIRIIQLNNSNKTEPSHSKIKDLQKGNSNNEV